MAAEIKFDQIGTPGGSPGQSYTNGTLDTGAEVTITNIGGGATTVAFLFVPPGDTTSVATLAQQTPTTYTFTPTAAIHGEWLVEITENAGTPTETKQRKSFGIRLPITQLLIPALNEQGDFTVGLNSTSAAKGTAALISDVNEAIADNGGVDQNGDAWTYLAWWESQRQLYLRVESNTVSLGADGNQIFIWDVDSALSPAIPNRFTTWPTVFAAANSYGGHCDILIYVEGPRANIPIPGPTGYGMNDRIGILWMGKFPIVLEFPDDTSFSDPRSIVATESEIWIDDLDTISSENQAVFAFTAEHNQNLPVGSVPDATGRFRGVRFNSHAGARHFISLFPEEVPDNNRDVKAIFERCQFVANPNHLIVTSQNLIVEFRDGCVGVLPGAAAAYYTDAGVTLLTLQEVFYDPPVLPPTADRVVDWNNGGATSILFNTEAHLDGFDPVVPGNWSSIPDNVGDALDFLIALGITGQFLQSFVDGDLTASVLSVNHALNQQYVVTAVYDQNGLLVIPTDVDVVDADNLTVDLTGIAPITGTWNLVVVGGAAGGTGVTDLQGAIDGGATGDIEVATPVGNEFQIRAADNTADVLLAFSRFGGIGDTIIKAPDELSAASGSIANELEIQGGGGGDSTGGGQAGGEGGGLDISSGFPGSTVSGAGGAGGELLVTTTTGTNSTTATFAGGSASDMQFTLGGGGSASTDGDGGTASSFVMAAASGGAADGTGRTAGNGSSFNVTLSAGGAGTNDADGGAGGVFLSVAGNGGSVAGATALAGPGGQFILVSGTGGNSVAQPGTGGLFLWTGGAGGNSLGSVVRGGSGGDFITTAGPGGADGGAGPGFSGIINISTSAGIISTSSISPSAGGNLLLSTGDGGNNNGTAASGGADGGDILFTTGIGGQELAGIPLSGDGGSFIVQLGAGGLKALAVNGAGVGGSFDFTAGTGGAGTIANSNGGEGGSVQLLSGPGGAATGVSSTAGLGGRLDLQTGDGGLAAVNANGGDSGVLAIVIGDGSNGDGTGAAGSAGDFTLDFGAGGNGATAGNASNWTVTGGAGGNALGSGNAGGTGTSFAYTGGVGGTGIDALSAIGGTIAMFTGAGGPATSNGGAGPGGGFVLVSGDGGESAFAGQAPAIGGALTCASGSGGAGTIAGVAGANAGQALFIGGTGGSSVDQPGGTGANVFLLAGLGGTGTPNGNQGACDIAGHSVTITANGNATLDGNVDIDTTTFGALILPRLTTVERDALTGIAGMVIYNVTTTVLNFFNGAVWAAV